MNPLDPVTKRPPESKEAKKIDPKIRELQKKLRQCTSQIFNGEKNHEKTQ